MSAEASRAYRELQRLARATGRGTQELLELYVHERFLARLARSSYKDRFVLKGGMLLTVLDVRRPTRDADLLARALSNEADAMEAIAAEIASIDAGDDGMTFDVASIRSEIIREEGEYGGLRIKMPAVLATAEHRRVRPLRQPRGVGRGRRQVRRDHVRPEQAPGRLAARRPRPGSRSARHRPRVRRERLRVRGAAAAPVRLTHNRLGSGAVAPGRSARGVDLRRARRRRSVDRPGSARLSRTTIWQG